MVHRGVDLLLVDEQLDRAGGGQPTVDAALGSHVGPLEVQRRQARVVPADTVPAAQPLEQPELGHPLDLRGETIRRYGPGVAAAGWESVVLDVPGEEHLIRLPMLEPGRGSRAHVGAALDQSPDVTALLAELRRLRG